MNLESLIKYIDVVDKLNYKDVDIKGISYNSNTINSHEIFVCLKGEHVDGHDFAQKAFEKGAVALMCEKPLNIEIPQIIVKSTQESIADLYKSIDSIKKAKDIAQKLLINYIEAKMQFATKHLKNVSIKYYSVLKDVAALYVDTMNIIHYMHDKYAYEKSQMALHDTFVHRYMAYGVAGLSVAVDSLSAIKNAKVKAIRNSLGITTDFEIDGTYPTYGNDIDEVDNIAISLTNYFHECLKKYKTYRDSEVTMSVLTITSNVVYGQKTGSTPDGRKAHVPFAPGANPMHNRDINGAISSLNSVAKINYERDCKDGISNTFSIVPSSLGKNIESQTTNLVTLLDGYFKNKGHHLNVNVLNREMLVDAMNNPDKYPLLTIRVSGYAVRFNKLTRKQQEEVISRTFHERF